MSGHEVYEASQNDYIEVVNIGEDNSVSEVTIFYRPNKEYYLENDDGFWMNEDQVNLN